ISVLTKNVIWAYVLLQLDEKAFLTHENVQWIKGLHLVQLVWPQITFAERRHPKIYERVAQCGLAKPTSARAVNRCGFHAIRRTVRFYLLFPAPMRSRAFWAAFSPLMNASSVQMYSQSP